MTRLVLATAMGWMASAAAMAAEPAATAPSPDWVVTVNGKLTATPSYPGSKTLGFLPYPTLSLRDANTPATFTSPDDNVSLALFDAGWLKAGPSLKFIGERRSSDDRSLRGLRDVPWALEAGGFVELYPMRQLRTRIDLREGFNGHHGIYADLGADWIQPWRNWQFSIGPRVALAGDGYTGKYFSVSNSEAVANGTIHPFKATGGLVSVGATGAATYRWSPTWSTTAWLRYDRLVGDAGASPIATKLGTADQVSFGLILSYSFVTKKLF